MKISFARKEKIMIKGGLKDCFVYKVIGEVNSSKKKQITIDKKGDDSLSISYIHKGLPKKETIRIREIIEFNDDNVNISLKNIVRIYGADSIFYLTEEAHKTLVE